MKADAKEIYVNVEKRLNAILDENREAIEENIKIEQQNFVNDLKNDLPKCLEIYSLSDVQKRAKANQMYEVCLTIGRNNTLEPLGLLRDFQDLKTIQILLSFRPKEICETYLVSIDIIKNFNRVHELIQKYQLGRVKAEVTLMQKYLNFLLFLYRAKAHQYIIDCALAQNQTCNYQELEYVKEKWGMKMEIDKNIMDSLEAVGEILALIDTLLKKAKETPSKENIERLWKILKLSVFRGTEPKYSFLKEILLPKREEKKPIFEPIKQRKLLKNKDLRLLREELKTYLTPNETLLRPLRIEEVGRIIEIMILLGKEEKLIVFLSKLQNENYLKSPYINEEKVYLYQKAKASENEEYRQIAEEIDLMYNYQMQSDTEEEKASWEQELNLQYNHLMRLFICEFSYDIDDAKKRLKEKEAED